MNRNKLAECLPNTIDTEVNAGKDQEGKEGESHTQQQGHLGSDPSIVEDDVRLNGCVGNVHLVLLKRRHRQFLRDIGNL